MIVCVGVTDAVLASLGHKNLGLIVGALGGLQLPKCLAQSLPLSGERSDLCIELLATLDSGIAAVKLKRGA